MILQTPVEIASGQWKIAPLERMLFVGSCFADEMGRRFAEQKFRALVNPFGVMYNPVSIVHTIGRLMDDSAMPFAEDEEGTAVLTLGTNHVYVLKSTGEVVDNCQKRPQSLFEERELSVEECAGALLSAITAIHARYPRVRFVLTVSPIRYRKYGYHGSQLSKATLLLAIDVVVQRCASLADEPQIVADYFPAYELMNDELRDYRFYKPDMLHPSEQAVDYIYQRFSETYFSPQAVQFVKEWEPIRAAMHHKPFNSESAEYQKFMDATRKKIDALKQKYPLLEI